MSAVAAPVITIRCQDCPDWEHTGVAAEARAEWFQHRYDEHEDYAPAPKAEKGPATPPGSEVDEIMDEVEEALEPRDPDVSETTRNDPESEPKPEVETEHVALRAKTAARASAGSRPRGYWTRERVVEAIQSFHAEHGRVPTANDLVAPMVTIPTIRRFFPTMNAAIAEAGFQPRPGGRGQRSAARPEPPPTTPAKGHPSGQKPTPIAPKAAPAQASEGTPEGTLVEDAERFVALVSEIGATRARLAQLEREARSLLDAIGQEIGG